MQTNVNDNLDKSKMPKHIGIIMDGNGRWAKRRGLPRTAGHKAGADTLKDIVEECVNLGIEYLTMYVFSTENWSRPQPEVDYLMNLLRDSIKNFEQDKRNEHVKLNVLGDVTKLSKDLQTEIFKIQNNNKKEIKINLNLAINYGGRDEIHNAIKNIIRDSKNGVINLETTEINSELISKYLYTNGIPDPELIIRTSGEQRLSNFLLYQSAYSELYFTSVLWPDFGKDELVKAIKDYQSRVRKFGGLV